MTTMPYGRLIALVAGLASVLLVALTASVVTAQEELDDEGLVAWFDAADYDENAGIWPDKSGNEHDAMQDIEGERPTYVEDGLNGNPAVSFVGRCCSLQSAPFDEPLEQPNTIFLVGKLHTVFTSGSFNYFIDGLGDGRHALYALTSEDWSMFAGNRGQTNLQADTDWNLHSAFFDGGSSYLWVNGVPNRPAVNVGSQDMTGITIGGHFDFNLLDGDIAEILVYDRALDDEERLEVEGYLQAKYDIEPDPDPYQMGQGTEDRGWVDGREADPTSEERFAVEVEQGVKIPMRDGTLLDADLELPQMDEPGPCAVIADGYGRITHRWDLPERGYAVVWAAMRGAGQSEGESGLYERYAEDGHDLVEWAADQEWCDGNVGMFGTSLVGISQWLAAKELPPSLEAIVPDVACGDCYEDLWYPGGMLPGPGREAREQFGPEYSSAIEHRDYNEWWRERTTTPQDLEAIAEAGIAVLATGGWQDYITPGNVRSFEGFATAGGDGKLLVAAGAHNDHQQHVNGPYTYVEHVTLFFDHFLRGEDNDWSDRTNNRGDALIWVNGPDQFRYEEAWPIPDTRPAQLHLREAQAGSIDSLNDGSLSAAAPAADEATVGYDYDPDDGPFLRTMRQSSSGITTVDQQPYEEEVLTWTTDELEEPAEVTGSISFEFWAEADVEDTDFVLSVTDVAPDGTSRYVTSGYLNAPRNESRAEPDPLEPGEIRQYHLDTQATSHVFKEGHRIRFSVAGGTTPAPGQGSPQGPGKNPNPASVIIYQNAEHPSTVEVPVIGTALLPTEEPAQAHPSSRDDCLDGGWEDFGFHNQGQCLRYVQTGQDTR